MTARGFSWISETENWDRVPVLPAPPSGHIVIDPLFGWILVQVVTFLKEKVFIPQAPQKSEFPSSVPMESDGGEHLSGSRNEETGLSTSCPRVIIITLVSTPPFSSSRLGGIEWSFYVAGWQLQGENWGIFPTDSDSAGWADHGTSTKSKGGSSLRLSGAGKTNPRSKMSFVSSRILWKKWIKLFRIN